MNILWSIAVNIFIEYNVNTLKSLLATQQISEATAHATATLASCSLQAKPQLFETYRIFVTKQLNRFNESSNKAQLMPFLQFVRGIQNEEFQDLIKYCLHRYYFDFWVDTNHVELLLYYYELRSFDLTDLRRILRLNQGDIIRTLSVLLSKNVFDIDLINTLRINHIQNHEQSYVKQLDAILFKLNSGLLPEVPDHLSTRYKILMQCSSATASKITQIMTQFTSGFGFIKTSGDDAGGKYFLAAIQYLKKNDYDFHPTLVPQNQFKEYLSCVSEIKAPCHERFVLMAQHWLSGEIEIDNQDTVRIFILDSLGARIESKIPISALKSIFKNKTIELYYCQQKRQHSNAGCSVFALDDVRHFHTLAKYDSQNRSLFKQLQEQCIDSTFIEGSQGTIRLNRCTLPISLIRTMQSGIVFSLIGSNENAIVNKRGQTLRNSLDQFFVNKQPNKAFENNRLSSKLNNMAEKIGNLVDEFLKNNAETGYQQLVAFAKQFELTAFQNRVVEQHQVNLRSDERENALKMPF